MDQLKKYLNDEEYDSDAVMDDMRNIRDYQEAAEQSNICQILQSQESIKNAHQYISRHLGIC